MPQTLSLDAIKDKYFRETEILLTDVKSLNEALIYFSLQIEVLEIENKKFLKLEFDSKSKGILYFFRGIVHYSLQNFREAIKDITFSIKLDKNDHRRYFVRSFIYYDLNNWTKAKKDYLRAMNFKSIKYWDPENILRLGNCFYKLNEYEEAIEIYNNLTEASAPQVSLFYSLRGKCYFNLNEYDKAIKDFNISINEFEIYHPYDFYARGVSKIRAKKIYKNRDVLDDISYAIELEDDSKLKCQYLEERFAIYQSMDLKLKYAQDFKVIKDICDTTNVSYDDYKYLEINFKDSSLKERARLGLEVVRKKTMKYEKRKLKYRGISY